VNRDPLFLRTLDDLASRAKSTDEYETTGIAANLRMTGHDTASALTLTGLLDAWSMSANRSLSRFR
jgi:hypothetical protein